MRAVDIMLDKNVGAGLVPAQCRATVIQGNHKGCPYTEYAVSGLPK